MSNKEVISNCDYFRTQSIEMTLSLLGIEGNGRIGIKGYDFYVKRN